MKRLVHYQCCTWSEGVELPPIQPTTTYHRVSSRPLERPSPLPPPVPAHHHHPVAPAGPRRARWEPAAHRADEARARKTGLAFQKLEEAAWRIYRDHHERQWAAMKEGRCDVVALREAQRTALVALFRRFLFFELPRLKVHSRRARDAQERLLALLEAEVRRGCPWRKISLLIQRAEEEEAAEEGGEEGEAAEEEVQQHPPSPPRLATVRLSPPCQPRPPPPRPSFTAAQARRRSLLGRQARATVGRDPHQGGGSGSGQGLQLAVIGKALLKRP
ncbi:uncharacterized protein LOC103282105 [Anolis carolinensis]|uniref:uncharacterized protein LOC103282105 n=1 Tax=Anolis carolinensis TaxID=28377 RepID=UPI002F2B3EA0